MDQGRKLSICIVSLALGLVKKLGNVQQVIVSFTPTVQEFDMRTFKENITKLYNADKPIEEEYKEYELLPSSLKILVDEVCYQYSVLGATRPHDTWRQELSPSVSRQIASLAYTIWKMKTFL